MTLGASMHNTHTHMHTHKILNEVQLPVISNHTSTSEASVAMTPTM